MMTGPYWDMWAIPELAGLGVISIAAALVLACSISPAIRAFTLFLVSLPVFVIGGLFGRRLP